MNSSTLPASVREQSRSATAHAAVLGAVMGVAVVAVNLYGTYANGHQEEHESSLLFVTAAALVVTALIYGVLVRRALAVAAVPGSDAGRTAKRMSIAALVLFPFTFWSGVPFALAIGGVAIGRAARTRAFEDGQSPRTATVAVRVGAVAAVLAMLLTIVGVFL